MTSGRTFASKIDGAVSTLEGQLKATTQRHDALASGKADTLRRIGQNFRTIARLYVDALDGQEIAARDELSRDALQVLESRDAERSELEGLLVTLQSMLDARVKTEEQAQAERDAVAARLATLCAGIDASLEGDAGHAALVASADQARDRARTAADKARLAAEERDQKAGAYEGDPIFMYLLKAGFGTPRYSAWPLVRTVDGWLARLCGFDKAARDYEALTALPGYLAEHAQAMAAGAAEAGALMDASRRAALERADVAPIESELEAKDAVLRRAAAAVEVARGQVIATRKAIGRMEEWRDDAGESLLKRLSAAFGTESIERMRARVSATDTPDDDRQLAEIVRLRDRLESIERERADVEATIRTQKKRLDDLAHVRREYRGRYNSSDYRISDSRASDLLAGYLAGRVMSDALWSGLQRCASYEPPPSPSYSSSSSSSSSGGFSTGGGFGGGGSDFRTGGGF